jgi:hypothetical protein
MCSSRRQQQQVAKTNTGQQQQPQLVDRLPNLAIFLKKDWLQIKMRGHL